MWANTKHRQKILSGAKTRYAPLVEKGRRVCKPRKCQKGVLKMLFRAPGWLSC